VESIAALNAAAFFPCFPFLAFFPFLQKRHDRRHFFARILILRFLRVFSTG